MAQKNQMDGRETNSLSEGKPSSQVNKEIFSSTRQQEFSVTSQESSSETRKSFSNEGPSSTEPSILHSNRHQPSKFFIKKCATELETLLSSVRVTYHEEIRTLQNEEIFADYFIHIGDFKKPLHRCILASRTHRFYLALRAFEISDPVFEEDIIIREFQSKVKEVTPIEPINSSETKGIETLNKNCVLPSDLISPEILSNFTRRTYLDQDLSEEESKFNQLLIEWVKKNRPELVRSSLKYSPDHKESFRTIQPLFEEFDYTKSSVMSSEPMASNFALDDEESIKVAEENPNVGDSLPGSNLTRTETFELISKNSYDGSNTSSSKLAYQTCSKEDESDDASNNERSGTTTPPYAPTTRTGLKPKTFTTPINHRSPRNSPSTAASKSAKPVNRDGSTKDRVVQSKLITSKQSTSPNSESKRSSLVQDQSELQQDFKQLAVNNKNRSSSLANKSGKIASIARAHPISMERSQSPATTAIKSSTRNFIAANKRFVSQIEKKIIPQNDQAHYDSEADTSDTNSNILEPLTSDNLTAYMDRFALISQSKLADALARLFIDGLLTDTIIIVNGEKHIRAHKCILAARSAFLAEVISKQTNSLGHQSSIDDQVKQMLKVDLSEFSFAVVNFSMMHIYSGIVKVPDDLDLEELTKLTNQLHITTLRQVCAYNMRMNYCHFFHHPCNICSIGVLKTLPLAWRYDYTDLYSRCLQWIGSHFANILCLKEFSELKPHDLVEECYAATMSHLSPENIISKTIECQRLLKSLPRVKWTDSVICLVGRLLEDFCHYVADNYEKVLQSDSFLNLGKSCWECEVLEENLLAAMNHLKPESGCKTLTQLHKIECSLESFSQDSRNINDTFINLITKLRKYCERYLLKEAAAVVHCSSWRYMNPSLQKRIKDQAILSTDFDEPTRQLAAKPKLPTISKNNQSKPDSPNCNSFAHEVTQSPSNRSTPESRLKTPGCNLPPPKSKAPAARHVKVIK